MPTYHYRCGWCHHEFEARQRFSEKPLTECPRCGGDVRRIISQVGLVFKGSGFYVTDNRDGAASASPNGKSKVNGKTESETSTISGTDSEAGSVSKSAKTGESAAAGQ
jgi:putative FmdB family regulatory protein